MINIHLVQRTVNDKGIKRLKHKSLFENYITNYLLIFKSKIDYCLQRYK